MMRHTSLSCLLMLAMISAVSVSAAAQHDAMPRRAMPGSATPAPPAPVSDPATFAQTVNLEHLGRLAVHAEGRVNSFGSYARNHMGFISGPRSVLNQSPVFTYLDLMLRPQAYADVPLIYVKNKPMRDQIATALRRSLEQHGPSALSGAPSDGMSQFNANSLQLAEAKLDADLAEFMNAGLISRTKLLDPLVQQTLSAMKQDLVRTARFVNDIETGLGASRPGALRENLRLIPPPAGGFEDRWLTFEDLADSLSRADHPLASVNLELKRDLLAQWKRLQTAWQAFDAVTVNDASAQLASLLPQVNPELYPGEGSRTGWPWSVESLDAAWISSVGFGGLCLLLMLVGIIAGRGTLAALGALGTAAAVIFHGSTLYLGTLNPLPLETWYFAAYNMTWVWILYALTLVPLLLTVVFRWEPARWIGLLMFLGAFGFHTAALFIRWYVSDRWPNSNMFEAVTTAAWFGGCAAILLELCVRRLPMRGFFALGSAAASMVALMCAYYMPTSLDPNIRNMMPVLHDLWLYIHTNVIIFSYCLIFMAAVSALLYLLYRFVGSFGGFGSENDYARVGGAGSLIEVTPDGQTYIAKVRSNLGQVLDGTTMILMEFSFVLLWAGLVMGAIWADHSWGRPWGWDPKEVFALNTFLVFAVLIHVRLKIRDKGFWTAVIALIGAGVMLFNWIAINFVVTGLHSYA